MQFFGFSPAIDGNDYRAYQGGGGVSNDPLGAVAHGDGHPVALHDAVVTLQTGCQGIDQGVKAVIAVALSLVHNKIYITVPASILQYVDDGLGSMFVGFIAIAIQAYIFDLEKGPRSSYLRALCLNISRCNSHCILLIRLCVLYCVCLYLWRQSAAPPYDPLCGGRHSRDQRDATRVVE